MSHIYIIIILAVIVIIIFLIYNYKKQKSQPIIPVIKENLNYGEQILLKYNDWWFTADDDITVFSKNTKIPLTIIDPNNKENNQSIKENTIFQLYFRNTQGNIKYLCRRGNIIYPSDTEANSIHNKWYFQRQNEKYILFSHLDSTCIGAGPFNDTISSNYPNYKINGTLYAPMFSIYNKICAFFDIIKTHPIIKPISFKPKPISFKPKPISFKPKPISFKPKPISFKPKPIDKLIDISPCGKEFPFKYDKSVPLNKRYSHVIPCTNIGPDTKTKEINGKKVCCYIGKGTPNEAMDNGYYLSQAFGGGKSLGYTAYYQPGIERTSNRVPWLHK